MMANDLLKLHHAPFLLYSVHVFEQRGGEERGRREREDG